MKCDNLIAYLGDELGFRRRLAMTAHLRLCAACRDDAVKWSRLIREIRQLEGGPVPPGLKDKLVADAMAAAASARARKASPVSLQSRIREVFTMRRGLLAAAVAAVVVAAAFGLLLFQGGGGALADVARAMASVKTAHLIGFEIDSRTGQRRTAEMWVKAPSKYRVREEGSGDMADNGQRFVDIRTSEGYVTATLAPSEGLSGLERYIPSLSLFNGEKAADYIMKMNDLELAGSRRGTLSDGRQASIIELRASSGGKILVTVDSTTGRLAKLEEYARDGRLVDAIERIEYDMDLPDSIFELEIPKNATVIDLTVPASADLEARREAVEQKLRASGAKSLGNIHPGGSWTFDSPYHSTIKFQTLPRIRFILYYLPDRDAYYVIGKLVVIDAGRPGSKRIVEDGEFRVSYRPDIPDETETVLLRIEKPGGYGVLPWRVDRLAARIENIGNGPLTVLQRNGPLTIEHRRPVKGLRIRGTARLLPSGAVLRNRVIEIRDVEKPLFGRLDPAKVAFGNLPGPAVKAMKQEIANHNVVAEWREMGNEVGKAGARAVGFFPDPNWGSCGSPHRGLRFEGLPDSGAAIYYVPDRNVYRVFGKVRVRYRDRLHGFEKVVENGEIQAPGLPAGL